MITRKNYRKMVFPRGGIIVLCIGLTSLLLMRIRNLFVFLFASSLPLTLFCQGHDSSVVDVSKFRVYKNITKNAAYAELGKNDVLPDGIPKLKFSMGKIQSFNTSPPISTMEKTSVVKFTLRNSADSVKQVYFLPGFFTRNLVLYKQVDSPTISPIQRLPDSLIEKAAYLGSVIIPMEPGEKANFYAQFNFIRTNTNNFIPRIIEKEYLRQWMLNVRDTTFMLDVVTYVISGIMMLMFFYSMAVYFRSGNMEFVYYSIYTFCSALLLFLKSFLFAKSSEFNNIYEEYLDFMILGFGAYCYLIFVRKFLNTRENHPFLEKFMKIGDWVLIGLLFAFSGLYFFTNTYTLLFILENFVIKGFILVIGIVFIVYGFKHRKDKLLRYLGWGNVALVSFSLLSLSMLLFQWKVIPGNNSSIFNRAMFYYEAGLTIELLCFLSGLAYKNRRDIIERVKQTEGLKLENERKEFEKLMAVMAAQQDERNRISADMHDELGSGMTVIRLMSEIVKAKVKDQSFPELEKISNSANDLLNKMNTIIWTMKSSNDSLASLVAYIRENALEYFESTPISCIVNVPKNIPDVEMTGDKRRSIFLSVKEALNNVLKHSQASTVNIDITIQNKELNILVSDDGIGINNEKLRQFGNGLSNMKRRMESINGKFFAESNGGSKISFSIPVELY